MKSLHTCIRVKDLDASLTFYQDALGYQLKRRQDFPDGKFTLAYLSLPGEDYELELTYNYDHPGYDLGNGYGHIAVGVENVLDSHTKHQTAGYPVTDLLGLPGREPFFYFIQDPDGYKIEVIGLAQFKQ